MSSSESVGVSLATVSDGSIHSCDGEMLSKLIAAASGSLDTLTSIKVFQQVVDSGSSMRAAARRDMATATGSDHARSVSECSLLSSAHYWTTRGTPESLLPLWQVAHSCYRSRTLSQEEGPSIDIFGMVRPSSVLST